MSRTEATEGSQPAYQVKNRTVVDRARNKAIYLGIRASGPVIEAGLERILSITPLVLPEEVQEEYLRLRGEGYVPANAANHTAQEDANSEAKWADAQFQLEESLPPERRLRDLRKPFAWSLNSGAQGPAIQGLYHAEMEFLEKHHIIPVHIVRAKDVTEDTRPNLLDYYKQLVAALKAGSGLSIFPEGDTWGGKRNEDGHINGMHSFQEDSIRSLVSAARLAEKKLMIMPIGLEGSFRIQDPETKLPTRWALRNGLGFSERPLKRVRVGLPIPTDQGELGELIGAKNWQGANELIGRKIAALVPANHRGIHRAHFSS